MSARERKELSRLGAVRLSRNQAIKSVHSCSYTQVMYTLMVGCTVEGQEQCLGYILYQDLGNKRYAQVLRKCIESKDTKVMNEGKKGDLV
eukprot:2452761-Heterocapsa_arctica.AAC.1